MEKNLKFEVGKKYFDKVWDENFTVKRIDKEKNKIGIKYENGTHGLCHDKGIVLHFLDYLESRLNIGRITLVEPEKTSE